MDEDPPVGGYVSCRTARQRLGVSASTLRRWADDGTVRTVRTPGNFRLYAIDDVLPLDPRSSRGQKDESAPRQRIVYCRVSSAGQKDDLERQVEYMRSKFPDHRVVTDIGSGINFRRKGLRSVLELSSRGLVEEVVVAYRDRLCRFAFELLEWIFSLHGSRLVVLHQDVDSSGESELAADLLAIVNVFNCRVNGRRKYRSPRGAGCGGRPTKQRTDDAVPAPPKDAGAGQDSEGDEGGKEEGDGACC